MRKRTILIAIVMAIVLLALPLTVSAATVTVIFGRESNGDNASTHQLEPHNVFISAGDTVDYVVDGGPHRVIIYPDGVTPDEVVVDGTGLVVNGLNGIPAGSIFQGVFRANASYTFTAPGKYLVICGIGRHFFNDGMFGWVFVE